MDTSLDTALPSRGEGHSSNTYRQALVLPSRQSALASGSTPPTRGTHQKQENHSAVACGPTLSTAGQTPPWAQLASRCKLWDSLDPIRTFGRNHHFPISNLTSTLGFLGPATRLQDLALPASSLALTPRHGFAYQLAGSSHRVFCTLIPSTSEKALTPVAPGVLLPGPTS